MGTVVLVSMIEYIGGSISIRPTPTNHKCQIKFIWVSMHMHTMLMKLTFRIIAIYMGALSY